MAAAAVESTMDTSDGDAAATSGLTSYFTSKIGGLERDVREKTLNLQRLTAQRNSLNARVRALREELHELQEPGSYVGEVVKAMSQTKILVKVNPEGKYVVDLGKGIDINDVKPNIRVALRNDSYELHKILPTKVDPLVSLMKVEKVPDSTYDMVGGCDKQIKEIKEVIELPIKHPELFESLGVAQPKGVLLYGPPGTGKTLLARAVAGEAGVPFISASGSEFVEMFVGVGASRVRDLFGQAKKNAPCIIFIDEIDAIGRQRSSGGGFASNDEREQTLNQILTEMDGFSGNTGVIVIAATNRADILDNALLRPGRFDRRVPVDLPDKAGRVEILKVHCRDKPLAPDVDLEAIASRAIGFSGASLQNLMNEAAIVAARREKDVITFDEIDFAIDRLQVGMQKPSTQGFQNKDAARKRQELVAQALVGLRVGGAQCRFKEGPEGGSVRREGAARSGGCIIQQT